MSRLYPGQWRALLTIRTEDGEDQILTEPSSYENVERLLLAVGPMEEKFEGHRVVRAKILGPFQPCMEH